MTPKEFVAKLNEVFASNEFPFTFLSSSYWDGELRMREVIFNPIAKQAADDNIMVYTFRGIYFDAEMHPYVKMPFIGNHSSYSDDKIYPVEYVQYVIKKHKGKKPMCFYAWNKKRRNKK